MGWIGVNKKQKEQNCFASTFFHFAYNVCSATKYDQWIILRSEKTLIEKM